MMQNLFGDQSEEEEEIDSEHESNPQPNYASVNKYSIHLFSYIYIYYIILNIIFWICSLAVRRVFFLLKLKTLTGLQCIALLLN